MLTIYIYILYVLLLKVITFNQVIVSEKATVVQLLTQEYRKSMQQEKEAAVEAGVSCAGQASL